VPVKKIKVVGFPIILRQGRTFQILDSTLIFGHRQTLPISDWQQVFLVFFNRLLLMVFSKIQFVPDQNDLYLRTVMTNLGLPLVTDILEWVLIDQWKTNEENILLLIGKRSQSVVIFLSGRVTKSKVDVSPVDHHVGRQVVVHVLGLLPWEVNACVVDQQSDGFVTNHDTLFCLHPILLISVLSWNKFEEILLLRFSILIVPWTKASESN